MGASISRTNGSRSSLKKFYDKTSKKTHLSTSVRVEPAITDNNKQNKNKNSSKKNKKLVTKSIIGKPLDFIHLNHAGVDYKSLDTIYVPNEQAEIIHITTANTNYATDHSYRSARQRIILEHEKKLEARNRKQHSASLKKYNWNSTLQTNYDNILAKELYTAAGDNISPEARVGIAY